MDYKDMNKIFNIQKMRQKLHSIKHIQKYATISQIKQVMYKEGSVGLYRKELIEKKTESKNQETKYKYTRVNSFHKFHCNSRDCNNDCKLQEIKPKQYTKNQADQSEESFREDVQIISLFHDIKVSAKDMQFVHCETSNMGDAIIRRARNLRVKSGVDIESMPKVMVKYDNNVYEEIYSVGLGNAWVTESVVCITIICYKFDINL